MPFPDVCGRVANRLEHFRQCDFTRRQATRGIGKEDAPIARRLTHAAAYGVTPSQQRRTTWCANLRSRIKACKSQAFRSHTVQVWRPDAGMTVATQIAVSEIVGKENDD